MTKKLTERSQPKQTVIATTGISLLRKLEERGLRGAIEAEDVQALLNRLRAETIETSALGAEISSIRSAIDHGHLTRDCRVVLCHSDTREGALCGRLLETLLRDEGHDVQLRRIDGLDDAKPARFRRTGLRNLANVLCGTVRSYGPSGCAIDATGGYKAQAAVAVQVGQALGVPVLYLHERFRQIIRMPPLPISLDRETWQRARGLLRLLRARDLVPLSEIEEDWQEEFEALVERDVINGVEHVALSPTGQVLDEAFANSVPSAEWLPPPAEKQQPPRFECAGWPGRHEVFERWVRDLCAKVPQIVSAHSVYYNRDLTRPPRAYLRGGEIQVELSDKGATVKLAIRTTAKDERQRDAVLEAIDRWIDTLG